MNKNAIIPGLDPELTNEDNDWFCLIHYCASDQDGLDMVVAHRAAGVRTGIEWAKDCLIAALTEHDATVEAPSVHWRALSREKIVPHDPGLNDPRGLGRTASSSAQLPTPDTQPMTKERMGDLLAEIDRLRAENAELQETIENMDHECEERLSRIHYDHVQQIERLEKRHD